jgi:hypothetical protein
MPRPTLLAIAVLALIVLAIAINYGYAPRLPVYRLAQAVVTVDSIPAPASMIFPAAVAGADTTDTPDRVILRYGSVRLEVYKATGGFWLEDSLRLWNPDSVPQLPDSSMLRQAAMSLSPPHSNPRVRHLSSDTTFTSFEFAGIRPTLCTIRDQAGVTKTVKLDWQATVAARVADPAHPGQRFPVVGGGGNYRIHYGDHGEVVGLHGVWREILGVARRERLIPRSKADQQYLSAFRGGHKVVFQPPRLAYYSAPAPFAQEELYPVYVYSGREIVDGDSLPLRVVLIPATRSGGGTGSSGYEPPQPLRTAADLPRPWSRDLDQGVPSKYPGRGRPFPYPIRPRREVATSWLGEIDGLPNSQANVAGLLEALRADHWDVDFDWGDANAWHQDWKEKRADWADAADLLFYCGHASSAGWKLFDPVNGTPDSPFYKRLSAADVAEVNETQKGMYGRRDLEWIVIAACGPLQDDSVCQGGGDAIGRWGGAFGGLHLLLGYASITYDNADEGSLFAKYALDGNTLVNAWLRAAEEVQPESNYESPPDGPTIWAGAMWAEEYKAKTSPYISPRHDHLWGHGDVAPDPRPPYAFGIIWSPT